MHRPTVGIIALVLLAAAAVGLAFSPQDDPGGIWAACLRVGLVVGALWLALPQLRRWPSWLGKAILLGALLLVAFKPKALVLAVGVYVVLIALRPRTDSPSTGKPERDAEKKKPDRGGASAGK